MDDQAEGQRPVLAVHIKADVQGSAEAVRDAVQVGPLPAASSDKATPVIMQHTWAGCCSCLHAFAQTVHRPQLCSAVCRPWGTSRSRSRS